MKNLAPALAFTLALGACTTHWAYLDQKRTDSEAGGGSGSWSGGRLGTGGSAPVGHSSGGSPEVDSGGAAGEASPGVGGASAGGGGVSVDGGVVGVGGVGAAPGIGGASESGAGGGVSEPPFVSYDADDPNLQYTGRIDFTAPKSPRFSVGVAQVRARFTGTALRVRLSDEFRYGTYRDYFDVVIDGARTKLSPEVGRTEYEVASALPDAEHSLTLVKRTEASIGKGRFLGLSVQGQLLAPPARPERRIEFIGDSISAGSGNEAVDGSSQCSADGWGQPYQSGDLAFGPVLARALDAEYQVTAVSGIGLVRNYSSMYDARPMPAVYDLLYLEDMSSPLWDRTRFVPDAIVIALGTNDFSPGDNPPENPRPHLSVDTFTNAYIAFVDTLLGYYPDAHIFGVSSPMLGDGWPTSSDTFASDQKGALSNVEAHYARLGETRVHKFFVTKQGGRGCGTHPDVAQHAQLAQEIGDYVKSVLDW